MAKENQTCKKKYQYNKNKKVEKTRLLSLHFLSIVNNNLDRLGLPDLVTSSDQ